MPMVVIVANVITVLSSPSRTAPLKLPGCSMALALLNHSGVIIVLFQRLAFVGDIKDAALGESASSVEEVRT